MDSCRAGLYLLNCDEKQKNHRQHQDKNSWKIENILFAERRRVLPTPFPQIEAILVTEHTYIL
jgi:hypothetical protein